jgi:Flp pilus assembly secretin CpaC
VFLKHDARSSSFASPRFTNRRRRIILILVALALFAVPLSFSRVSRLLAQTNAPTEAQPIGNKDRLARGIDEYKHDQYEEALTDLQQVNGDQLVPSDHDDLNTYLSKAEASANMRKAARAEFEQGEEALAASKPVDAAGHYKAALKNKYIDSGTKAKAKEELSLAESMIKQSGQSLKDMYAQAVADYKAGNYESARTKFRQLDAAEYHPGLFRKSPAGFLSDIDSKVGPAPTQAAVAQAPAAPATAPAVAPPAAQESGPTPQIAVTPSEPTPAPTAQQPAPSEPQAPQAPAAPTAPTETAVAPPAPTPTPAVAAAPTTTETAVAPQPAPAPGSDAKTAYRTARDQYRQGDWNAARKNFEIARDLGYKPGLFEDSPEKYLARMDAKERRDAEQAAAVPTPGSPGGEAVTAAATTQQADQHIEAQKLVEQAEASRAAYRMDEAMALYTRALEIDPTNNAAKTGRDDLQRELSKGTSAPDLLAKREQEIIQQRQYITYNFNTAIDNANRAIDAKDFTSAQASIESARAARAVNPGVFQEDQIRQFDQTIAQTQQNLDRAAEQARLADAATARTQAAKTIEEQRRIADEEKRQTIADLIKESRRLTSEGHYQQAMGVLDHILLLDPHNDYAMGARPLVEDRALIMEQRTYKERYDRNATRQYNQADEQLIPYSDILKFPENWPDLSATREKSVAIERGERAEDQAVVTQLERKLPEVRFDNVGFADVVDFLRDVSSANIFVNWKALETAGIDRNAPVTARLRDVKFSKALETILKDVGGGTVKLGYTIDEGVISISTEEDLASNVVTRVYDIRDLIINVPDFDMPPNFQLQGSTAGGSGGNQQLFNSTQQNGQTGTNVRADLIANITKLIQDTVASESWKDNGGNIGSIRELAGQLIVTQTPENLRSLARLLEQLRETRAIQITVETRFLTVQRNFLEEVGVDLDFNLNAGALGNNVGAVNISNSTLQYTTLNNLSTGLPGNIATELNGLTTTGSAVPNLSVSGSGTTPGTPISFFLDNFQVTTLLRATQIAQNTTTLTAPRLTLFNGQRSYVVVATETAYVSDLTPIVGTSSVAFDPTVGIVQSGVLLDVQATVSADRKYVTLTLRPILSRLRSLTNFPVTALAVNNGVTGGTGSVTQTAFLQQPVRDITSVNTTVSVPDGGTLLLGGQTLTGEIERDSGIPILSKIPFLKRLFTNSSSTKDEQVLLILVKPTIVIQREKEQEQFPLLSTK